MIFQTAYKPIEKPRILIEGGMEKTIDDILRYIPSRPYKVRLPEYEKIKEYEIVTSYPLIGYGEVSPERKADYIIQALITMTGAKTLYVDSSQLDMDVAGMAWPYEKFAVVKDNLPVVPGGKHERAKQQVLIHELLHILHPEKSEREIRILTQQLLPFKSSLPDGFN